MMSAEDVIRQLQQQLGEKDEQLLLAGQLGKQLLDRNSELNEELDKRSKEHATDIERLEQEKYSLQLKLEQKSFSERTYNEEVESLKETLKREREQHQLALETVNQSELSTLKSQLSTARNECEKSQLSERQLRERNAEIEGLLAEAQERIKQKVNMLNETASEEIASLHSDIANLQNDKLALLKELGFLKDDSEHLRLQLESSSQQLAVKTEEAEQLQCQITSYFNTLEKAREEIQELRAEIDLLRMEGQDQKKKGNSLFAEVEDRRIEAEKQLITMKVQHDSVKKQLDATRQQLHRLKMQIAGLLQMSGRQADGEHIERLERQLFQARAQVDELTTKLHKVETNSNAMCGDYDAAFRQQMGPSEEKDYIDFLKALLDKKDVSLREKEKELNTKSLLLVAESDKLVQCERKQYSLQKQYQTLQAQCIKQNVKIEELTAKYEPEKMQAGRKLRKTITEKIPMTSDDQNPDDNQSKAAKEKEEQILSNLQKSDTNRDKASKNSVHDATQLDNQSTVVSNGNNIQRAPDNDLKSVHKVPLKTVTNSAVKSVDETEHKKKRYELKSVKVKKVSLADDDEHMVDESHDVTSVEMMSHDNEVENRNSASHVRKEKNKKSQQKKIIIPSDGPANECQTQ